jgi:hypothetical protein
MLELVPPAQAELLPPFAAKIHKSFYSAIIPYKKNCCKGKGGNFLLFLPVGGIKTTPVSLSPSVILSFLFTNNYYRHEKELILFPPEK